LQLPQTGCGQNPVDECVGAAIRSRRLGLDMTLAELADAMGVAPSLLEAYEDGRKRVEAEHLLRIAAALGAPVSAFFQWTKDWS